MGMNIYYYAFFSVHIMRFWIKYRTFAKIFMRGETLQTLKSRWDYYKKNFPSTPFMLFQRR